MSKEVLDDIDTVKAERSLRREAEQYALKVEREKAAIERLLLQAEAALHWILAKRYIIRGVDYIAGNECVQIASRYFIETGRMPKPVETDRGKHKAKDACPTFYHRVQTQENGVRA